MTTTKLLTILIGVMVTVALLVGVAVAGIVAFVFYQIGNSGAAATARDFLGKNERLQQDIGEIRDFGSFVTGNINIQNNDGEASLVIKVIGEKRTVNATVELSSRAPLEGYRSFI